MMTIDERAERLAGRMPQISITQDTDNKQFALSMLLEVARDQRHACAEAATEASPHPMWDFSKVHQAVMNASIK